MRVLRVVGLVAAAALMAGCSLTSGNVSPFSSTAAPVIAVATPPEPPPVAYGAFLEGSVGAKLTRPTRDKVLAAEQDALASGQRKTWKGDNGTFGFVEPVGASPKPAVTDADGTAPPPAAACRTFTSTVFVGGRSQVGHGSGCQNPDGSYRITG